MTFEPSIKFNPRRVPTSAPAFWIFNGSDPETMSAAICQLEKAESQHEKFCPRRMNPAVERARPRRPAQNQRGPQRQLPLNVWDTARQRRRFGQLKQWQELIPQDGGSPAWIRTTIHGSKGRCPTIRRPGKIGLDLPSLPARALTRNEHTRYNDLGRQSGLVFGAVFKTVRRPCVAGVFDSHCLPPFSFHISSLSICTAQYRIGM